MNVRWPVLLLLSIPALAGPPWHKTDTNSWSSADIDRILNDSPWAVPSAATFPDPRDHDAIPAQNLPGAAQAGMASSRGATDGRWDGGVSSNHGGGVLPSIPVLVRWESAAPIRAAEQRRKPTLSPVEPANDKRAPADSIIISVTGFIPAGDYGAARVQTSSSSSSSSSSDNDHSPAAKAQSTEQLLENLMSSTLLSVHGALLHPRNVSIENETGKVSFVFQREIGNQLLLTTKDKDALFRTRYGALTVKAHFRPASMLYGGQLSF